MATHKVAFRGECLHLLCWVLSVWVSHKLRSRNSLLEKDDHTGAKTSKNVGLRRFFLIALMVWFFSLSTPSNRYPGSNFMNEKVWKLSEQN